MAPLESPTKPSEGRDEPGCAAAEGWVTESLRRMVSRVPRIDCMLSSTDVILLYIDEADISLGVILDDDEILTDPATGLLGMPGGGVTVGWGDTPGGWRGPIVVVCVPTVEMESSSLGPSRKLNRLGSGLWEGDTVGVESTIAKSNPISSLVSCSRTSSSGLATHCAVSSHCDRAWRSIAGAVKNLSGERGVDVESLKVEILFSFKLLLKQFCENRPLTNTFSTIVFISSAIVVHVAL